MSWEIVVLYAVVLGLLVKTNLSEDRIKKLGEFTHGAIVRHGSPVDERRGQLWNSSSHF